MIDRIAWFCLPRALRARVSYVQKVPKVEIPLVLKSRYNSDDLNSKHASFTCIGCFHTRRRTNLLNVQIPLQFDWPTNVKSRRPIPLVLSDLKKKIDGQWTDKLHKFECMKTFTRYGLVTEPFVPTFFPPTILKTSRKPSLLSIVSFPRCAYLSICSSDVNLGRTYVDLFVWTGKSSS